MRKKLSQRLKGWERKKFLIQNSMRFFQNNVSILATRKKNMSIKALYFDTLLGYGHGLDMKKKEIWRKK